jgi:hypothetical protein
MADKLDLIINKLNALELKLNTLINALSEGDGLDDEQLFDFDGNASGGERDINQEL